MIMQKKRRRNINKLITVCSLTLLCAAEIAVGIGTYTEDISEEVTPIHETVDTYDDGIPFEDIIETPSEVTEPIRVAQS